MSAKAWRNRRRRAREIAPRRAGFVELIMIYELRGWTLSAQRVRNLWHRLTGKWLP